MPAPRVLVCYSRESATHTQRVLDFVQRLRHDGVDAWVDRFEPAPPQGWPRWIFDQLERADFIVLVCTETYRRHFEGKAVPSPERGVAWEAMLARQLLYENRIDLERLVPVVFEGTHSDAIPHEVRGATFHELYVGYSDLVARVNRKLAVVAAPLGHGSDLGMPGQRPDTEERPRMAQSAHSSSRPSAKRMFIYAAAMLAFGGIAASTSVLLSRKVPAFEKAKEHNEPAWTSPAMPTPNNTTATGISSSTPHATLEIEACEIQVSDGPTIRNGWILLGSGDFFEAQIAGSSLRFTCPDQPNDRIAVIVNFQDGSIRYWPNVEASPAASPMLSIDDSSPVPDELRGRLPVARANANDASSTSVSGEPTVSHVGAGGAKTTNRDRGATGASSGSMHQNTETLDATDFDTVIKICTQNANEWSEKQYSVHLWCDRSARKFRFGAGVERNPQKAAEIFLVDCPASLLSCDEAHKYYADQCNTESDALSCYRAGVAIPPSGSSVDHVRREWFAKACDFGHAQSCAEL